MSDGRSIGATVATALAVILLAGCGGSGSKSPAGNGTAHPKRKPTAAQFQAAVQRTCRSAGVHLRKTFASVRGELSSSQAGRMRKAETVLKKTGGALRTFARRLGSLRPPASEAPAFGRFHSGLLSTGRAMTRLAGDIGRRDRPALKRDALALAHDSQRIEAAVRKLPALRHCGG